MFSKSVGMMVALFAITFVAVGLKKASKSEDVVVFDVDNVVVLRGAVTDSSASALVKELQMRRFDDLYLFIHSPGGSVIAGNQIVDTIKSHKGKITCYASEAVSMAFVILQACPVRLVSPHSIVMQHEASYGVNGQAGHNLSFVTFLHGMLRKMDQAQADRIGISYEEFKKRIAFDWWMDGIDAVMQNAADRTVVAACTKELTEVKTPQTLKGLFSSIEVEWSGCPLVSYPINIKTDAKNEEGEKEIVKELADFIEANCSKITDTVRVRSILEKNFIRIR
jgi:ATP-dependent protease ClpP protease subunit